MLFISGTPISKKSIPFWFTKRSSNSSKISTRWPSVCLWKWKNIQISYNIIPHIPRLWIPCRTAVLPSLTICLLFLFMRTSIIMFIMTWILAYVTLSGTSSFFLTIRDAHQIRQMCFPFSLMPNSLIHSRNHAMLVCQRATNNALTNKKQVLWCNVILSLCCDYNFC